MKMRKDEIQVGKTYTNGKGGSRKVIAIRHYRFCEDEAIFDNLTGRKPAFNIFNGPHAGLYYVGVSSFARWAVSEVKEGEYA